MKVDISVPGPQNLTVEEQRLLLEQCAADLLALGLPLEGLKITSDDLVLEVDCLGTQ